MIKIKEFFKVKRNLAIVGIVFLVILFFGRGAMVQRAEKKAAEEAERQAEIDANLSESDQDMSDDTVEEVDEDDFGDAYLKQIQPDLIKSYGRLPEGYMWDLEGNMFSLGDKEMTAEEVVYAYLTGIRTLDLSMAQKYSRGSYVVSTYSDFFDTQSVYDADYYDSFIRSMFKESLLSIKVEGISDSAVFAENKQVFTINATMLDLTDKDFWLNEKEKIFDDLYVYQADEDDSTKGEMYLYDYVLKHYQSGKAKTKKVSFDLTVERYPDLDTGWLISIDKDIYDACMYTDGTLMVNYIMQEFLDKGLSPRIERSFQKSVDADDPDSGRVRDEDDSSEEPVEEPIEEPAEEGAEPVEEGSEE